MWSVVLAAMLLLLSGPVSAQTYESGRAAAERGDYATAIRIWRQLADQGDPKSMYSMGGTYSMGLGVPKDRELSDAWYHKAELGFRRLAEQGNVEAMARLGSMLIFAYPAEDMKWWIMASEHGDIQTMAAVCNMYSIGRGVPQDKIQAYLWCNLAAAGGDKDARLQRDQLESEMAPPQIIEAQRLSREWRRK